MEPVVTHQTSWLESTGVCGVTLFVTAADYILLSLVRECMHALAKLLNGNCRVSGWFGGGQQAEQGVWWGSQ